MKITKNWFDKKEAGGLGWEELTEWFMNQKEADGIKVVKALIADNKFGGANWLIVNLMSYKQYVSYAVFSIERVIDIYQKKYPKDKRPLKAIKAAKKCINNPSKENRGAAQAAVRYYTYVAGGAPEEVGYAVDSAVTAAVRRIAPAAGVAAIKACIAGGEEVRTKIFNYGIKLLETK
jgi:hypothetical protein